MSNAALDPAVNRSVLGIIGASANLEMAVAQQKAALVLEELNQECPMCVRILHRLLVRFKAHIFLPRILHRNVLSCMRFNNKGSIRASHDQ